MRSSARVFRHRGAKLVGVWADPEPRRRAPAVLFLHGFPGSEQNVDLQRELLRKGVASFALHFRGAWGSEGIYRFSSLVGDARAALRFLRRQPRVDSRRLGIFGFSMGGWAAIHVSALEPSLRAAAAVAPVGGSEMLRPDSSSRIARLSEPLRAGSPAALAKDFARAVRRWDPARSAERRRCPLLLVHGTRDELVPLAVSRRIFAAARAPKRLVVVSGARHDFLDRRAWLVRLAARWFLRRL